MHSSRHPSALGCPAISRPLKGHRGIRGFLIADDGLPIYEATMRSEVRAKRSPSDSLAGAYVPSVRFSASSFVSSQPFYPLFDVFFISCYHVAHCSSTRASEKSCETQYNFAWSYNYKLYTLAFASGKVTYNLRLSLMLGVAECITLR